MKRPYFTLEQREAIRKDTYVGAHLKLHLTARMLLRNVRKEHGWIAMKKAERLLVRIANVKFYGMDRPRKWWQIF